MNGEEQKEEKRCKVYNKKAMQANVKRATALLVENGF